MLKKILVGLVVVLLVSTVAVACASPAPGPEPSPTSAASPEKVYQLKFSAPIPPAYPAAKYFVPAMTDEIKSRSKGKVDVAVYYAGALGTAEEHYNIVLTGLADFVYVPLSYTAGRFPLSDVAMLPLAGNHYNLADAMNALMDKGLFNKEFTDVVLLGFTPGAMHGFLFQKQKPMTVKDFAGIKVRSPGGYLSEFLKAIGMVPVTLGIAESYGALEKGIVDAMSFGPSTCVANKLNELKPKSFLDIKYGGTGAIAVLFNKDKWATLPSDVQNVIRQVVKDYNKAFYKGFDETDVDAKKVMQAAGTEFYQLPAAELKQMKDVAAATWEGYMTKYADKGAREVVKEYVAAAKEAWRRAASLSVIRDEHF